MTTNWDKALTYITDIRSIDNTYGKGRANEALSALLKAGGTFAISQGKLHTSDFSTLVLKQLLTDWSNAVEPAKIPE